MSAVAAWSYTATATHWSLLSRAGRTGALTFAAPAQFRCDYSGEARRERDSLGVEFVAQLTIDTERSTVKPGDRVMLGASTAADPITAGALEVRAVKRYGDTFDRKADDYRLVC